MKVLVTGGLGFIGTGVVRKLRALGHTVSVIDSMEARVHGSPDSVTQIGDLLRLKHVGDAGYTDVYDLDAVVHLAAQVGVADSMADPMRYIRQNTYETCQFLEVLRGMRPGPPALARLVVASSMSVYGDPETSEPVTERHRTEPASVYGLTKFDQERLCRMWGNVNGVPTVALRFFNVYGPGQALSNPYTGVIANFAQRLLHNQAPTVYEDGQQTRDFVYVDDVVDAVIVAATTAQTSGTYNVCTGVPTTIAEMALKLAGAMSTYIGPDITHSARPGDIRHCIGDNTLFRQTFNWQPKFDVTTGLARYAEALFKT